MKNSKINKIGKHVKSWTYLVIVLGMNWLFIVCKNDIRPGEDPEDPEEPGDSTYVVNIDLYSLNEAVGANSGIKGSIYVINYQNFSQGFGGSQSRFYDAEKFMVSLQGIKNRTGPTILVGDADGNTWFTYFRYSTDGMLYGYKRETINTLDDFINIFLPDITSLGLVIWDPMQPFTSNIASTVCGVEGYLPVMYSDNDNSLFNILTQKGVPVKMDLRDKFTGSGTIWDSGIQSSGSAKCDAYLWAMEKYLKTGKCSKDYIAYMQDAWPFNGNLNNPTYFYENSIYSTYLPDQDFLIMKAAFFVCLMPFPDDIPNDDRNQFLGLDYQILCEIFRQQYHNNNGKFSQLVGFAPFIHKYSSLVGGKYDAVMHEFQIVEVATAHNITVQADCPGPCSIHNCSLYTHAKNDKTYSQAFKRPVTLPAYDPKKKYVFFYVGDYDAGSWTLNIGTRRWHDEDRGKLPLAWAFNPNLYERIPQFFDFVHITATAKDIFVAGDSGAGYVMPALLEEGKRKHSTLPDGLNAWVDWCDMWYKKFDITLTPFIMDGNNGPTNVKVLNAYAKFSPDGAAVWTYPGDYYGNSVVSGMPVIGIPQSNGLDVYSSMDWNINAVLNLIENSFTNVPFYIIKTNIDNPSRLLTIFNQAKERNPKLELLDAYTFYAMVKREIYK